MLDRLKILLRIILISALYGALANSFVFAEGEIMFYQPVQRLKDHLENKGMAVEIAYTGEFRANTRGGMKRDETYLGNLDVTMTLNTERAGLWKDGAFFVYMLDNHGSDKLTGEIVGDLQTVSNIEAPRTTRLFEIWYEHAFLDDAFSILMGIHDYNSEFNVSEQGALFINSSLGIGPEVSTNGRPSIFPLSAPGGRLKWAPLEDWQILFGAYDGNPGDPEESEHLPRSIFDSDGGAFIATELAYFPDAEDDAAIPDAVKLGTWVNTGHFDDVLDLDAAGNAISRDGNYGIYVIVDKMLYREAPGQGLGGFLQVGFAPEHLNEVEYYVGSGLQYVGLIPERDADQFGMAVAYASISDDLVGAGGRDDAETILEVTYRAQICDNFTIQPDVQFVFNPGADPALRNAVVAGLRFELII